MEKPYYQTDHTKILLTQGMVASIQATDYTDLASHKWYARKTGRTYYALRQIIVDGKPTAEYMHRRIMGAKKGELIDHIDGNGLNNTRSNLRFSNKSQNALNQHRHRSGSPEIGTRHIAYGKRKKRYTAQINFNGRQIGLGYFLTQEEATAAYKKVYELMKPGLGKENYERDFSHYHCWNQGKFPACGLPKDTHEICCLCAIPRRKKTAP